MRYDFTTTLDRSQAGSFKWEQMKAWNPDVQEGVIPFSVADMELLNPPEIIQGLKDYLDNLVLGYTGPTQAYYDAVVGFMKRRHNWDIKQEWLVQTGGVVSAFYNAVRMLTEPGDGVMMFTPVYYPFYSAAKLQQRQLVRMPLTLQDGRYDIDYDLLEQHAKDPKNKVLLLCSPHNPIGRVWLKDELKRVADICLKHGVVIISDEIHFDLIMPGHQHTVLATLGEEVAQNSIILTAPSKTFNLAGLQCSNAVIANDTLRERFQAGLKAAGIGMLNIFSYKACEIAYNQCEDWLEQLIDLVYSNHQLVKEHFEQHLPQVHIFPLEGTYLQWMDFRPLGLSEQELEQVMHRDAQVFMDEGYVFGSEGSGFERLNLAAPQKAIQDACERMVNALKKGA